MRCHACENNEAHAAVICDRCREHYAAIREGHYAERVVAVGELNLAVRSWVAVGAPAEKQKRREEKAPKAKGAGPAWMKLVPGKAAEVPAPAAEEEAPPPPDWKNRVFPVPDADEAPPAIAAPAPDALDYGGETEFSYGTGQLDESAVLDLSAPPTEPEPIALAQEAEAPVLELTPAAEADEPEPRVMSLESSVPQAIEPVFEPVVEEAPAPAPELSSFFESLAAPEAPAPVVEEPEPAPAPAPELSSFFESLSAPAPEAPAAPEPEPVEAPAPIAADLANFFSSLSTPTEAAPAPAAEPTPEPTPTPGPDLSSFFESLSAPAAEAPAPVVEAAPAEPEAPAELSSFFDSLSTPAPAEAVAEPVVEPEPVAAPTPSAPAPAPELAGFFETIAAPAAATDGPVVDFFESLAAPAPAAEAFSFAAPPAAPVPEVANDKKPFSIELDLSMNPAAASPASHAAQRQTGELKPPTHGQPFTIDLGGNEPKPQPKKSSTAELKRQHSTAGAGFDLVADDDDDDVSGGSLFEGISFGSGAHDDDDDERTIEL